MKIVSNYVWAYVSFVVGFVSRGGVRSVWVVRLVSRGINRVGNSNGQESSGSKEDLQFERVLLKIVFLLLVWDFALPPCWCLEECLDRTDALTVDVLRFYTRSLWTRVMCRIGFESRGCKACNEMPSPFCFYWNKPSQPSHFLTRIEITRFALMPSHFSEKIKISCEINLRIGHELQWVMYI